MGKRHLKSLRNLIKAHSKKEGSLNEILGARTQDPAALNPIEQILDETKYFWFKKKNWNKTMPSIVSMMLLCVLLVYQNCGGVGGGTGASNTNTRSLASSTLITPEYDESCSPRVASTSGGIRVSCTVSGALLYGAQVSIAGKSCKDVVVVDKSRFYCDVPANPVGVYDIQITNTDSKTIHLQKAFAYQDYSLYLQPYSIYHGQTRLIEATGGVKPYFYYIESGNGTINTTTGQFNAPENFEGETKIFVLDSIGQKYSSQISIGSLPLELSPNVASVVPSGNIQFVSQGGIKPYNYSIISGGGEIDSDGNFTIGVGAATGETKIKLTDFKGRTSIATITVAAIAISPSQVELAISNTVPLVVSGGKAPYRFELSNSNGVINSEKIFTANTVGETKVRIYDSYGAFADSVITIRPSLSVTPKYSKLLIGQKTQFVVSGGVPPYHTEGTGGGVFDSSYNYSATSEGNWSYALIDKLGNRVSVTNEVRKPLSATVATPMKLQAQQTIAISGGFPPYHFQVENIDTGSISDAGIYSSNLNTGSGRVTAFDSLNNSAVYVIEKVLPSITYTGSTTMPSYGSMSLSMTGIYPPYSATITSGGSIDSQNTICSPWTMEPIRMTITDAVGYSKDFEILKSSTIIPLPAPKINQSSAKNFLILKDGSALIMVSNNLLRYLDPCGRKIWEKTISFPVDTSSLYEMADGTFLLNNSGQLTKIRKSDGYSLKLATLSGWNANSQLHASDGRIIYLVMNSYYIYYYIYDENLIQTFQSTPESLSSGFISFHGIDPSGRFIFYVMGYQGNTYINQMRFFDKITNSIVSTKNLGDQQFFLACAVSESRYITTIASGIQAYLPIAIRSLVPNLYEFKIQVYSNEVNSTTIFGANEIVETDEQGGVTSRNNFSWDTSGHDNLGRVMTQGQYCVNPFKLGYTHISDGLVLSDGTRIFKYQMFPKIRYRTMLTNPLF